MNRNSFLIGFAAICFGLSTAAVSQVTPVPTAAASQATPIPTASTPEASSGVVKAPTDQNSEESSTDEEDSETGKPFEPHWTGQLGLTYSTQPSQLGQGQQSEELSFTGTLDLTESGHYLSLGLTGGQQLLEGANTNYGQVTAEGGLGLGPFQPSLSLSVQEGASALASYSSTLNLNYQFLDFLTAGLTGGLGLENHQGPASAIYPNSLSPDNFIEVDTGNWTAGADVTFNPWDFESLTLTGQLETDLTFQTQGINHNNVKAINEADQIPSLTLQSSTTFLKDWQLALTIQLGWEYYSAGTIFSPVLGKTVTFTQATAQSFTGYTVGMTYNFQ